MGLACWCASRTGDTDEARARFQAVISQNPDNASAARGLAMLPEPDTFNPYAHGFFQKFQGHPWRDYQAGVAAGLDSSIDGNFIVDFGCLAIDQSVLT